MMTQLTEHFTRFRRRTVNFAETLLAHLSIGFCVCGVFATGLALQAQVDNLTVTSSTPPPYQANVSITTSGSVIVNGSASVTYTTGSQIYLEPGFTATAGTAATTFRAVIAPPPTYTTITSSPSGRLVTVDGAS